MKKLFIWFVAAAICSETIASIYVPSEIEIPEQPVENWIIASIRLRALDLPFGNGHLCSGTLFSMNKILTAANCLVQDMQLYHFFDPRKLRVVLGTTNRMVRLETTIVISRDIQYAYHPKYNTETYENNICVIFLRPGVLKHHPYIKPIPLNKKSLASGTSCRNAGFGFGVTDNINSSALLWTKIDILQINTCKEHLGIFLYDGILCAGDMSGNTDLCDLDLGVGLLCDNNLVAVISLERVCDTEKLIVGIYSDVTFYSQWIENAIPMEISGEICISHSQHLFLFGVNLGIYFVTFNI